jgi:hypothetical protein
MKTMPTIKSIIDGYTPKVKTFWIVITLLSMSTIAMTSVMQYSSATPAASATTVTIAKGLKIVIIKNSMFLHKQQLSLEVQ